MPRRYSVVCDDDVAERVDALAREYDLTEQEVLRQLLEWGLEVSVDQQESELVDA
jgi:predicted transcriptional regulator